jgi:uncharacterized ferritin-like protein (DUF455 family)
LGAALSQPESHPWVDSGKALEDEMIAAVTCSARLPRRGVSVDESVTRLDGFAHVLSRFTMLLSSWVATTPELEVKMMLGNHVYRDAVSARALRARITELCRDPSDSPLLDDGWHSILGALSQCSETLPRLHGMYQVARRRLLDEVLAHAQRTHEIWDEPTVLVLRDVARNLAEQTSWATSVQDEVHSTFYPELSAGEPERRWEAVLAEITGSTPFELPSRPDLVTDPRMNYEDDVLPLSVSTPEGTANFLHFLCVAVEVGTIEVCGRMITDFPEMPNEFVLDMGRQCWDESRHAYLLYDRIKQLGARIGEFPVAHEAWDLTVGLPLEQRLAVHQMTGEWLGVDLAISAAAKLATTGDEITARMFDYITIDEIAHTSFGRKWIRYLLGDSQKEAELHEWAIGYRNEHRKRSAPVSLPVNRWACERAGFTAEEIDRLEKTRANPPLVRASDDG